MHIIHSHIQKLFKIKSELQEIYWNSVIENFAKSLIGIFIPIYLLVLGFSLFTTIVFVMFYYLVLVIFSPFSAKLTARVGYKHQILYQIPIQVTFYLLLIFMQFYPFPVWLLYFTAVIGGFSSCLYWIPMNAEFTKNTEKLHEGEEIAEMVALPRLASIAAPTVAALVLTAMGFPILFTIVIALLMISVIPLFATRDYKGMFTFSQERTLFLKEKRSSFKTLLRGMLMVLEPIIWPLFIFLTFQSLLEVGIAVSISAIGIAFFTIITGKMSDKGKRKSLMKIGGLAYSLVWFSRIFASTPMEIYLLSFLGGMFAAVLEITVFSSFCDLARGKKVLDWVVVREVWLGLGRLILFLILIFVLGIDLRLGFAVGSIVSFLFIFL